MRRSPSNKSPAAAPIGRVVMEERAHDALSQGELYNQGGNFTGQGGARSRTPDRRKQGTPKSLFWQSRIRVDFAGMGEEKLRSHFLVQRNGVNEGQATRETDPGCDTFGAAMPQSRRSSADRRLLRKPATLLVWNADKRVLG